MANVDIIINLIDKTGPGTRGAGSNFEKIKTSALQLAAGFAAVTAAAILVGKAYEATVGETMKYTDSIRDLMEISGQNAEQTSRFVQVLDDYQLTAGDAEAATRALTKNGLAPNIETLAKLSDQYLSINDAQAKNEFIIKNLGRAGLQWVNVLKQGGDALRQQADAVNKNLILTDKSVAATEKYRLQVDNLNDQILALKITIGNELIPVLSQAIDSSNAWAASMDKASEATGRTDQRSRIYLGAIIAQREKTFAAVDAIHAHADALDNDTAAADTNAQSLDDIAKAAKSLSDHYQAQLSLIGSMQSAEDSYEANAKQLADERVKLEQDKATLISQGYSEQGANVMELNGKLAENSAASAANAAQHDLDNKKIILGYLEQQLAADGLTTAEMNFLLEKGQAWGIYSETVVKEAKTAQAEAQNYINTLGAIPDSISTTITANYVTTLTQGSTWSDNKQNATGGSWVVPAGYGTEGYHMDGGYTASAGEKVTVTPAGGGSSSVTDLSPATIKAISRAVAQAVSQRGG